MIGIWTPIRRSYVSTITISKDFRALPLWTNQQCLRLRRQQGAAPLLVHGPRLIRWVIEIRSYNSAIRQSNDPTVRQSRSEKISGRCRSGQTNSALGYEENRALPL